MHVAYARKEPFMYLHKPAGVNILAIFFGHEMATEAVCEFSS